MQLREGRIKWLRNKREQEVVGKGKECNTPGRCNRQIRGKRPSKHLQRPSILTPSASCIVRVIPMFALTLSCFMKFLLNLLKCGRLMKCTLDGLVKDRN